MLLILFSLFALFVFALSVAVRDFIVVVIAAPVLVLVLAVSWVRLRSNPKQNHDTSFSTPTKHNITTHKISSSSKTLVVYIFIVPSIYLYMYVSIYLTIDRSIYPYNDLSIYLSIDLSIVYLSSDPLTR